jgi:outer membrane protein TolC
MIMFDHQWRCRLAGAAMALALFAGPAGAGPLTLDQAVSAAASSQSPASTAKTLDERATLERSVAEGAPPDPMLMLGFQNVPVNLGYDTMTMKTIGVSQEFVSPEKRRACGAAVAAGAAVTEAERQMLLVDRRTEAGRAWFDLVFDRRALDYLRDLRKEAVLDRDAAKAAFRGLAGSQADIVAAQAQISALDNRITQQEGEIELARDRLARWTGDAQADAAGGFPDLDVSPIPAAHLLDVAAAHPGVAIYDARARQAEAELHAAESERRRDYTVEAWYGQRDRISDMAGVTVRIPLQINRKNRQNRVVAARELAVEQVAAEREEALQEHELHIRELVIAWRTARERVQRYGRSLAPLADAQVEAAVAAYRGGTGTLAQVIAARRSRFDVLIEALSVERDSARNWAELYALKDAHHMNMEGGAR